MAPRNDETTGKQTISMPKTVSRDEKLAFLQELEEDIDNVIGQYFWKKQIASAFWAQISMPVNLSITIITALTTAQATTNDMLPDGAQSALSVTCLLLSVLNTFFRPHVQMTKNIETMNKWNVIGNKFDVLYFSPAKDGANLDRLIGDYLMLRKEISSQRQAEGPDSINFLTDLIHTCAQGCCLRKRSRWLDLQRNLKSKNQKDNIYQQRMLDRIMIELPSPSVVVSRAPSRAPTPPRSPYANLQEYKPYLRAAASELNKLPTLLQRSRAQSEDTQTTTPPKNVIVQFVNETPDKSLETSTESQTP